jgi:4-amino-4-deoxy-L-arabinose transferase-like glycosyltransferase
VKKFLFTIFLIALVLRTISLGNLPYGFHSDEARVAWNSYSILETGKDDRGNILALYYNTFGDYRPTGIFYFTIPSIQVFGLNEFSTRFPSALVGSLTVIVMFFLTKELTKNKKVAYLASFFLAISSWHIVVSRATSEVVISLFFALLAILFLLKSIKNNNIYFLAGSLLSFLISFLLYHSIRLVGPIICVVVIAYFFRKSKLKKYLILFLLIISAISFIFLQTKGGQGRFNQVGLINQHTPFIKSFIDQYLQYFSGGFLIGNIALPQRYVVPQTGLLFYSEFIFFLAGIWAIIRTKKNYLLLILLLIAPVAAALTNEDSPNLHRSLLMLPLIIIIASYGFMYLVKQNLLQKIFISFLLLGFLLQGIFFYKQYTKATVIANAQVRNAANRDLVIYLNEVANNYQQVILTNDPDDPYPWYAIFNNLKPEEFNQFAIKRSEGTWQYKNILFTQKECPSGDYFPGKFDPPSSANILVVDSFKCPIESKISDGMQAKILNQFYYPDGKIAYTIWSRKN